MAIGHRARWSLLALLLPCAIASRAPRSPTASIATAPARTQPAQRWSFDPRVTQWLPALGDAPRIVSVDALRVRALSGRWRFELSSTNALTVARERPSHSLALALSRGDHWLFLSSRGALYRAETFTGALTKVQNLDAALLRTAPYRDRLLVVDVRGRLFDLVDDRFVLRIGPPTARVLGAARSSWGALFALDDEHQWLRLAPRAQQWVRTPWTGDIARAIRDIGHESERIGWCATGFDGECTTQPECLWVEREVPEDHRREIERIRAATRELGPERSAPSAARVEVSFDERDARVPTGDALVIDGEETLCVRFRDGTRECVINTYDVATGDPSREPRMHQGCAVVALTRLHEQALAFLYTFCPGEAPRWSRLPPETSGFALFDERRGVAWGDDRELLWRTSDGGAGWKRVTHTFSSGPDERRGAWRTIAARDPSRGVLFADRFWLSAED